MSWCRIYFPIILPSIYWVSFLVWVWETIETAALESIRRSKYKTPPATLSLPRFISLHFSLPAISFLSQTNFPSRILPLKQRNPSFPPFSNLKPSPTFHSNFAVFGLKMRIRKEGSLNDDNAAFRSFFPVLIFVLVSSAPRSGHAATDTGNPAAVQLFAQAVYNKFKNFNSLFDDSVRKQLRYCIDNV